MCYGLMKFFGNQRGKEDILSRFLLESKKDPKKMNDQYLRDIILSFVIAGKDTSADTLTWFFYLLCKHPLVQEKVVLEVREATKAQINISADEFAKKITEKSLDKMQYLHAALTETLRLYPAVPMVMCAHFDLSPCSFSIYPPWLQYGGAKGFTTLAVPYNHHIFSYVLWEFYVVGFLLPPALFLFSYLRLGIRFEILLNRSSISMLCT